MFEYCPIIEHTCPMCAIEREVLYCGQQKNENKILKMKFCPIKVKKRGLDSLVKKRMGQNF